MASYKWTGAAGDGSYSNPANWNPNGVPGPTDNVVISTSVATTIDASDGSAGSLKIGTHVALDIDNNSNFTFGAGTGTSKFTNDGTFSLGASNATLLIDDKKLVLSGNGTVMLGGGATIEGATANDVLNNKSNLIEGGGQLGNGQLKFENGAKGVVDANGAGQLVLNTGSIATSNAGLLEATSGGGMVIESSVTNTARGMIDAAGTTVFIDNGATVSGGTITSSGGGSIQASGAVTLNGVTNAGLLALADSGALSLLGTITNTGTITENTISNHNSTLVIGPSSGKIGTTVLAGGGQVVLDANGGNLIVAGQSGDTLDNVNNTIEGTGQFGGGGLNFSNQAGGMVNAGAGTQLVMNTGTFAMSNAGLFESTAGGSLVIESTVINTASGTVTAAGGNVYLAGGSIFGGTVTSSLGAMVQASGAATLSGVTNTGLFALADSGTLSLLGKITNTGTITENTVSNHASTIVIGPFSGNAGTVSLAGGGLVLLSDNFGNFIVSGQPGDTLDNLNNTIAGTGQIGGGGLNFSNEAHGVVDAGVGSVLVLNTGTVAMSNAGLFESTSGGSLVIESAVQNAGSGMVSAAGGNVYLQGGSISGGTLTSTGGAMVQASGSASLNGVANKGLFALADGGTLSLLGTITNTGTITENTVSNHESTIVIGPFSGNAGTLALTGGGMFLLSDNGGNMIVAGQTGDTLDNKNNIIEGTGQIGFGNLNVINGGTICGSETGTLTIDVAALSNSGTILAGGTGGTSVIGTITNTGVFESLTGSTLTIAGQFSNEAGGTFTAEGGTVDLAGITIANLGLIDLTSSPEISITGTIDNGTTGTFYASAALLNLDGGALDGGTIANSAGGSIVIGGAETFNGLAQTVTNLGWVNVTGQTLTLLGTIANQGTLALDNFTGFPDASVLLVDSEAVTLNGFGTITLEDAYNDQIVGGASGDVLDNVNNTIVGSGQIIGEMSMINGASGIIDASGTNGFGSNGLTIDLDGTLTNDGLIEATGATLYIDSTIENNSHIILAAGAVVSLDGGTIEGGTLESSGAGSLAVVNGRGTLDGSVQAVTNTGSILVAGQTLSLLGTLTNNGIIALYNTPGYPLSSGLECDGTELVLNGGGTILLEDRGNDFIDGANLLDNVDNLIQGSGTIGGMDIINGANGIIQASSAHGNGSDGMIINVIDHTLTNDGLIETSGVTLTIYGTIIQSVDGVILAAAGTVDLMGSIIEGGIIETSGGGSFVSASGNNTFDGSKSPVTLMSSVEVVSGTSLTLLGSIVNDNQIDLLAYTSSADLVIASPTFTLSGGGTIALSDNRGNLIVGTTASTLLDNQTNTIEGAGQLGDGTLTLINGGTISATGANSLVIDLSGAGTNTASGQLLGAGDGGLAIQGGAITNNGIIAAEDGSLVVFSGSASLTNDSASGTLTGGTYEALASADGATLSVSGAAVVTDLANILMQGAGSVIQFGGVALDNSLSDIATTGTLSLLSGANFNATGNGGSFTANGALNVDDASFTATVLTIAAAGQLTGYGNVQGAVVDSGAVVASGGTLLLSGALSGTGTLSANAGDTVSLSAGGSLSETFVGGGTLDLAGGAWTLSTAVTGADAGTLAVAGGASLSGAGTIACAVDNFGLISGGGGTLAFMGAVSNGATIDTASGLARFSDIITGTGTLQIGATATLSLLDGTAIGQTVEFLAAGGLLDLTDSISFLGAIAGFGSGAEIDLLNTPESGYSYKAGVLTVTDHGTTVASLNFNGSYTKADFTVGTDHHGGTTITFA